MLNNPKLPILTIIKFVILIIAVIIFTGLMVQRAYKADIGLETTVLSINI